ncbi:hypothetical protein [Paenibacillus motobuensis]|uniref:Aminoacyl-transfer RNA synthetases class-II family profile domain-containing protein n=1 Tax=Paenibacillus motobuensis TaxID=295324 RepID=A0ABN0XXA6_9BACL
MNSIYTKLLASGQLSNTGYHYGTYAYSGLFWKLLLAIDELFTELAKEAYNIIEEQYPTIFPLTELNNINYFYKFPSFPIISFPLNKDDHKINQQISDDAKAMKIDDGYFKHHPHFFSDEKCFVYNPSTCYHTFLNRKNSTPSKRLTVVTAVSQCARNERLDPANPMRLRNFTMRECIFIGDHEKVEAQANAFFHKLVDEIIQLVDTVDLKYASDMFFGEGHKTIEDFQIESKVKLEMTLPIPSETCNTDKIDLACMSRNLHNKFLCKSFGIKSDEFSVESACVAVGLERLTYALLCNCGFEIEEWRECRLKDILLNKLTAN